MKPEVKQRWRYIGMSGEEYNFIAEIVKVYDGDRLTFDVQVVSCGPKALVHNNKKYFGQYPCNWEYLLGQDPHEFD